MTGGMKKRIRVLAGLMMVVLGISTQAWAAVKPAEIFTDGMVLQRDMELPVWGTADVGEKITVSFSGQTKESVAGNDGRWLVKLDPLKASSQSQVMIISSSQTPQSPNLTIAKSPNLQITNILVGEVWVYAGGVHAVRGNRLQSDAAAIVEEIKTSPTKDLRLFWAELKTAPAPQQDISGCWLTADAGTAGTLPSNAYYIGRKLVADLGVPVGIVVTANWNGQPIEAWLSKEALMRNPEAKPILDFYASSEWKQKSEASYEAREKAWMEYCQTLPLYPPPKPTQDDKRAENAKQQEPSAVWNAMVAPLTRLAVRGVVWDHGDEVGNLHRAVQYGQLLPGLIADWRSAAGNPQLPFVIVQLRPCLNAVTYGWDGRLAAELRDGQKAAASEAKASLVITIDLPKDPHPREVGPRIATTILADVYKKDGVLAAGPELTGAEIVGNKIILRFRNTQGGLAAKGGTLRGFAIASSLYRWVWADAEIKGDTIIVSAPTVDKPEGVRYAYQDLPEHGANLYNGIGCPAAPFRTDAHLTVSGQLVKPDSNSILNANYNARKDLGMENPRLPRILIIGDSISGHYLDPVREALRDRANVIGESSMGKEGTWASMGPRLYTSVFALTDDALKHFLAERGPFVIVHFNMGIHEFSWGSAKTSDAKAYAERLRKIVAVIRESGAIPIFANSTGTIADNTIPNAPNYLTNCKAFNAAAEKVMAELNVPVTDIFGATQPQIEKLISPDRIHLNKDGDAVISKLVIERISDALNKLPAN